MLKDYQFRVTKEKDNITLVCIKVKIVSSVNHYVTDYLQTPLDVFAIGSISDFSEQFNIVFIHVVIYV